MPASVEPAAPFRRAAHAVPALTTSPTPSPTTKRPASSPGAPWKSIRMVLPNTAMSEPANATRRPPKRSASAPPTRRLGTKPSA